MLLGLILGFAAGYGLCYSGYLKGLSIRNPIVLKKESVNEEQFDSKTTKDN